MTGYKLVYFKARGLAQVIRNILEDNGIEYVEENVTGETWPEYKTKMITGQVPCLYDGDLELAQTSAIVRHLARKHGLCGASETETALIDMIDETQKDVRQKFSRMLYTKGDYEAEKEQYLKNLPTDLERIEKLLKRNNGGKGFFVGDKISYADYSVFDLLDIHTMYKADCLDNFPLLKAFAARIAGREKLAKYLARDDVKNMRVTGSGHL